MGLVACKVGGMKLTTAHQVLIVGAIGLGAIYAIRSVAMYARGDGSMHLALAAAGLRLAACVALYLPLFRQ